MMIADKKTKSSKKMNAADLRRKIAIDTTLSGKGLVDLAKEGK
jgi:hypothetical protein